MARISLTGQILEVERELQQRAKVYPRLVAAQKMKQGVADLLVERMEAVLATLRWLEKNEADVRGFVEARKAASGGAG